VANVIMQTSNLSTALRDIYSALLRQAARQNLIMNQAIEIWDEPGTQHGEKVYRTIHKQHKGTPGELSETTDPDSTPMSAYNIDISVREHGDTIQLTEKLKRLTFQPIVGQRVLDVGWGMGVTLDQLAFWAHMETSNIWYANSKSARASLVAGDTIDSTTVRKMVRNMGRRNATPFGGAGGYWLAYISPDLHFDMTGDDDWLAPHNYQDTYALYRNEIGMWFNARFVESTACKLPNAGAKTVETTLSADVAKLATTFSCSAGSSFTAGDVVTIGYAGITDMDDENFDETTEEVEVGSVSSNTITLATGSHFQFPHSSGDAAVLGADIHPIIMVGENAVARAQALAPELRVQEPVDKLQRLNSVGWYGIFGYGISHAWNLEVVECCPSA